MLFAREGLRYGKSTITKGKFMQKETFVTNFSLDKRNKYESAIEKSGRSDLSISDEAYDRDGHMIADYCSLHFQGYGDLGSFWDIFNQL